MRKARWCVAAALAMWTGLAVYADSSVRVLEPASTGGIGALDRALARLSTHKRLLIVAAHPDDEDTRLLALVAQGLGGEAAYLSLSRGEGGQNLIGPELGVGLGLIRSRELLAARRIDGARQYFTRAFDFGYTRSLDETRTLWPEDALLDDAVRVIRRFKPQVIVAVFPPGARAGHGQHWLSGMLAPQAMVAAGDTDRGHARDPQPPWTPQAFYRSSWSSPEATTVRMPLGVIDPATGRSILQLALDSRSQHRSQDMGLIQPLGNAETSLTWEEGAGGKPADGTDVFAGIDTRLAALAATLPAGPLRTDVTASLNRIEALAQGARDRLTPRSMRAAVAPLREIVERLDAVSSSLVAARTAGNGATSGDANPVDAIAVVEALMAEKAEIAAEALATAAGIAVDAFTEQETVVPGARFSVRAVLWRSGDRADDAGEGVAVTLDGDEAWEVVDMRDAEPAGRRFATTVTADRVLDVAVPPDAPLSMPYFLRRPRAGYLYDWSAAVPSERAEPFGRPPLVVRFRFDVEGTPVTVAREVVYRTVDQAYGEVRRPLRVVPALTVGVAPADAVWRIGATREMQLRVAVRSHRDAPTTAAVVVAVPDGWPVVAPVPIELAAHGRSIMEIPVIAPPSLHPGRYSVGVAAVTPDGQRYELDLPVIDYEHIRPTPMPVPATVAINAGEIALPALNRVGYVRGASDRVPEALEAIGVPIELLDAAALADADLAAFDTIVIGSRAYETDPALVAANGRLLDYARGGGLLIVQYQQYAFVRGGFAPFALDIARPHDRTTDELAPVRVLDPEHAVFNRPNRLAPDDWDGWVQERGLYFARTWEAPFTPLLAMPDPEGVEREGVLLVAPVGTGHYVYTGLAFFRQLPAGVTGAFRLFANLLALGDDR